MGKINKLRFSKYDKEWSRLVRDKTPYCWYCGNNGPLDAHHFIRRSIKITRLNLLNGISLCKSHHVFNHEFSAHKTPEKFERWFKKKYPGHYKFLRKEAQKHMTEREAIKQFLLTKEV